MINKNKRKNQSPLAQVVLSSSTTKPPMLTEVQESKQAMKKWFGLTLMISLGTTLGIGLTMVHAGSNKADLNCQVQALKVLGDAAEVVGTNRRNLNLELLDQTQKALNRARKCMRPDQKKIDQNLAKLLGRIRAEILFDIPICDDVDSPVEGCTAEGWPLHLPPPQHRQVCNAGLWGRPNNL